MIHERNLQNLQGWITAVEEDAEEQQSMEARTLCSTN